MKRFWITILCGTLAVFTYAEDRIIAATKHVEQPAAPAVLNLSLSEAQDYAVSRNRSLRNAELAVQQAYAQRWQTIAAMLPSVDATWGYTNMCGYTMEMNMGGMPVKIEMPNNSSLSIQTAVGLNGQAIVGALLNNIAIDMQKLSKEQSELSLRTNVISAYASVLVLKNVVNLMDSSYQNVERLYEMTQRSVEVGAAEQTAADQIKVRVNTLRNNISANERSISLAEAALKVLLDVPVTTELTLTTPLDDMLSAETVLNLLGEDFVIANNLSYQLLEKNVDLAKKNVAMAAVAYGPTVAAFHQYSSQKYYGDGGFRMTPPNTIGVQISMPLWSSGKRAAGVIDKKIALEEARNSFAETADNLGIQNQQLRYSLQNAYETYMNEKDNIEVSGRVFQSTTNKFNYGAASNLELVNASNDLITAQSSYIQAALNLVQAQASLQEFLNTK